MGPRGGVRARRATTPPVIPLVRRRPVTRVRLTETRTLATRQGTPPPAGIALVVTAPKRRQISATTPGRAPPDVHVTGRRVLRGPALRARLAPLLAPAVPARRGRVGRVAGVSSAVVVRQP